jgi:hypothetical protein
MTQIWIVYIVSFVAPEGAQAGTADRQCKTQIVLKFVSVHVPVQGKCNDTNLNTIHCVPLPLKGRRQALPTGSTIHKLYYHVSRFTAAIVQGTCNDTNLNNILCRSLPWKGQGQALRTGSAIHQIYKQMCQCVSLVQSGFTRAIVQGARNDTHLNHILCVLRCPCSRGGKHCRKATQDTNYIKIRVIACSLYSQGSQRQSCEGHAMTQILIIYIVSFVAPEEAKSGSADKQRNIQIILKFASVHVPVQGTRNDTNLNNIHCVFRCQAAQCQTYVKLCVSACPRTRDMQWHKSK